MTAAQRSVAHCLAMLAPGETEDPGERAFYDFMRSLYTDMEKEPEAFYVFSAPYEAYLRQRTERNAPRPEKAHAADSRESSLRNTFQHQIQFYASYLYALGCRGQWTETGLRLTRVAMAQVQKEMERTPDKKQHALRYALLRDRGLRTEEKGEEFLFSFPDAPEIAEGWKTLCLSPETPYKWMNFLRLDFRNAAGTAPSVVDICKTLPQKYTQVIREMEESLSAFPLKKRIRPLRGIVSDFQWKVEYVSRGKNMLGFYAHPDSLTLCVYFNDFRNINVLAAWLESEEPALFEWFRAQLPERLCVCPYNRRVKLGEENRRICGFSNRTETRDPTPRDVENALRVFRKFRFPET